MTTPPPRRHNQKNGRLPDQFDGPVRRQAGRQGRRRRRTSRPRHDHGLRVNLFGRSIGRYFDRGWATLDPSPTTSSGTLRAMCNHQLRAWMTRALPPPTRSRITRLPDGAGSSPFPRAAQFKGDMVKRNGCAFDGRGRVFARVWVI